MASKTSSKKSSKKGKARGKAKSIRKKSKSGKPTEIVYHSTKEIKVERALIENFIGLQKVMVNLSSRFDSLSSQISKLLELFEISAKSLARKELSPEKSVDSKQIIEKLDTLSKQAGLIGKGLALIHEVGTENENPVIPLRPMNRQPPMAMQTMPKPTQPIPMKPGIPLSEPQKAQRMTKETGGSEKGMKSPGFGENAS